MTLAATPSLNADDHVAFAQHTEVDGLFDTPFQTTVDILLPVCLVEVGLLTRKQEWIDSTIQMRILYVIS